jgi:hypothetical protein
MLYCTHVSKSPTKTEATNPLSLVHLLRYNFSFNSTSYDVDSNRELTKNLLKASHSETEQSWTHGITAQLLVNDKREKRKA